MYGMQLQLFNDLPLPPRPTQYCDEVAYAIVDKVLKSIISWMYHGKFSPPQRELDDLKEDIFTAIQWSDDPFEIAKNLEQAGWDCDGELVDLLGCVSKYRSEAYEDFIQHKWILKYGVEPKLSAGDVVSFKYKGSFDTGEVTKIYPSSAKYLVYCSHRGHVKEGVGTHGHIIPFEDCLPTEVNS